MARPVDRYLMALPRRGGRVFLSWRLLADDPVDLGFVVERREPGGEWRRACDAPITDSTNYIDQAPQRRAYEYRVATWGDSEAASEAVSVDAGAVPTIKVVDAPLQSRGPSTHHLAAGDLLNDGRMGFVCTCRQEGQLHLDAYASDGRHLWRRSLGYPTTLAIGHTCGPYLAWDVNHDGRCEVLCRLATGGWQEELRAARKTCPDGVVRDGALQADPREGDTLCALDGETGEAVWEVPWPGETFEAHMTLAYLRGRDACPCVVVHDGRCYGTTRLYAIDGQSGERVWQVTQDRPTGHNLDVGDIDGDGVQEVIAGGVCRNGDGTVRWEAEPFGHTDISKPANIDPSRPGLEVYYAVESGNPGVYLVDKDGRTIFREPYRHAHYGWIARHSGTAIGLQPHTAEDARAEYGAQSDGMRERQHNPVFLPDGTHLLNLSERQRKNYVPVQWGAGAQTVFVVRKEHRLVRLLGDGRDEPLAEPELPLGGRYGRNLLCMDLLGDYRENIATIDDQRDRLMVLANGELAKSRGRSPTDDLAYRHDRSQHGSGYYIYLAPPLTVV